MKESSIIFPKEDTSSSTVSTEVLMLSCMIETTEDRDLATANITWNFLKTGYDKGYIHINIGGQNCDSIRGNIPSLIQVLYLYI